MIVPEVLRRLGCKVIEMHCDGSGVFPHDLPVIVRSEMNGATGRMLRKVPTAHVTDACGPAGWAEAVASLLDGWRDDAPRTKARHWLG